jgi:hypothetical protein
VTVVRRLSVLLNEPFSCPMQVLVSGDGGFALIASDRGLQCRHLGRSAAQGIEELARDRGSLLQQFFTDSVPLSRQVHLLAPLSCMKLLPHLRGHRHAACVIIVHGSLFWLIAQPHMIRRRQNGRTYTCRLRQTPTCSCWHHTR